jgi:hypothetical protein
MELRHFFSAAGARIDPASPSERAMSPEIPGTFRWLQRTEDELVSAARG